MSDATPVSAPDRLELTAEIVSAYVANNPLPTTDLAALIASVHAALTHITDGTSTTPMKTTTDVAKPTPAQIRKSITPDVLIHTHGAEDRAHHRFNTIDAATGLPSRGTLVPPPLHRAQHCP